MTFNEFQKLLNDRIPDPQMRYVLATMYEHIMAMAEQVDANAKVLLALAQTFERIVTLNEATQQRVGHLNKLVTGAHDGVSLSSVSIADDPGKPS